MRNKFYLAAATLAVFAWVAFAGCNFSKKSNEAQQIVDKNNNRVQQPDTTVYGICGEATAMHTLELITDAGDTITYMIPDTGEPIVKGGMLVGDRMAVLGHQTADGEMFADQIVNLTTLLGKWESIDKRFELLDGGDIKSEVKAEKHLWTQWKMLNGKLLFNTDTFTVYALGADTLSLENNDGIFTFKRAH